LAFDALAHTNIKGKLRRGPSIIQFANAKIFGKKKGEKKERKKRGCKSSFGFSLDDKNFCF